MTTKAHYKPILAHDCSKIGNFCKHGKINTEDFKHIFSFFVSIEYINKKILYLMLLRKLILYYKSKNLSNSLLQNLEIGNVFIKGNWNSLKSTHGLVEKLFIF